MEIAVKDCKGGKTIELSGEVDLYSSPELRKKIMGFVNKKEKEILVDFSGVSYIDSSGIATLVEALKGMMVYEGRLILIGLKEDIMEIFTFARLDKVFNITKQR